MRRTKQERPISAAAQLRREKLFDALGPVAGGLTNALLIAWTTDTLEFRARRRGRRSEAVRERLLG